MGLLDRFKKDSRPDALTIEAVARARAVPGVAAAEAVDADTVAVTWVGQPGQSTLSLTDVRVAWAKASGFDRIELMDELIATLGPPVADAQPDLPAPDATPIAEAIRTPEAGPTTPTGSPAADAWDAARPRLRVVVGRPGDHAGAVSWPVADVLEARVVLGGPGALPVDGHDAAGWGVDADAVRHAALANLAATDPALDAVGAGQPAWVPTEPADHPPVWLAAPDRLLAGCGLDELVALAPLPTELVVVDPRAHELLSSILTSTEQIVAAESRVLWPTPLLVTADGVTPWQPDPSHPCADQVARMAGG